MGDMSRVPAVEPIGCTCTIGRMTLTLSGRRMTAQNGLPTGAGPVLKRAVSGRREPRRKGTGTKCPSRANDPVWQVTEYARARRITLGEAYAIAGMSTHNLSERMMEHVPPIERAWQTPLADVVPLHARAGHVRRVAA